MVRPSTRSLRFTPTRSPRLKLSTPNGQTKGPRGPLHGVSVLLKDNVDTYDLPTTGGSQLLAGNLPPDDAFITPKLRAAGAIILAKVNLSEWAGSGGSFSGSPPDIAQQGRVPNGFSSAGG